MMKNDVPVNITMSQELHEKVKKMAKRDQRSVSAQIRFILLKHFKKEE